MRGEWQREEGSDEVEARKGHRDESPRVPDQSGHDASVSF